MGEDNCNYETIFSSVASFGTSTYLDSICGSTIGSQFSLLLDTSNQSGISSAIPFSTLMGILLMPLSLSSETLDMQDKTNYSSVERNAKLIYDRFNKTHEVDESISGLIIPTSELAERLDKILKSNDKNTLYETLTAIQEVLQEIQSDKEKEDAFQLKKQHNVNP